MTNIPSSADVVVIGGGVGGLTAGALLTKAGLSVVVVESERRLGGYLAGFERKKFKFDSAIHWLNQCAPGGFVHKMFEHIASDPPECPPLQRIRRLKSESFDYMLTRNPEELCDRFIEDFPADARGLRNMFDDAKKINECFAEMSAQMRVRESRSPFEMPGYGLRMARTGLTFLKHIKHDVESGFRRYGITSGLADVFCTERDLLSVLVPLAWAYGGDFQAPPVGGSQVLPQWLCSQIRDSGSHVILNQRVEQILLDGQRAVGIRLTGGETIKAGHVLAACDVETVYEKMLRPGSVPEGLLKRLRNAEIYDSSAVVSLGLDCPSQELGFDESMINLTRDGQKRADHGSGDPHKGVLNILSPSARDATLAPPGKGTLTIFCSAKMDYADRWGLEADGSQGERYQDFKQSYGQVLIDRVTKALAPELQRHIEVTNIATPVTLWRYTGNKDGTMMGAKPGAANIKKKIAHYRTPIDRLLLSGHWAEYGGGVPVAVKAATNASLLVLKDLGHPSYRELCDVMDRR